MTRKSQQVVHQILFAFRMLKTIVRYGHFLYHRPGYLTLFWQFWSLVRPCISNYDFFWSFWHSTNQISQEIWNSTQFEPAWWRFLVWSWPNKWILAISCTDPFQQISGILPSNVHIPRLQHPVTHNNCYLVSIFHKNLPNFKKSEFWSKTHDLTLFNPKITIFISFLSCLWADLYDQGKNLY